MFRIRGLSVKRLKDVTERKGLDYGNFPEKLIPQIEKEAESAKWYGKDYYKIIYVIGKGIWKTLN